MNRWLALLVVLAGCPKHSEKKKPVEPPPPVAGDAQDRLLPDPDTGPLTLAPAPALPAVPAGLPAPPANPRITAEAVAFGELLFHDPRLAQNSARACAKCHDPETGYSGNVQLAADGKQNLRRTPAIVNLAWAKAFGWDGRYTTFAEHLPPHLKGQLGDPLDVVAARIAEVPLYKLHIARVGGSPQDAIVQALEAYVLTRYEGGAAWDAMERTVRTKPGTLSNDPIIAGYQLFAGKAQCATCHPPPLYTDEGYHTVAPNPLKDPGNKGAFKTPTLRGAALRTSFFHSGGIRTLDDAVAQYTQGGADVDPVVAKIKLSPDEQKQVVAFLKALTADRPPPAKPVLP